MSGAEWLHETGIGEARAALVLNGSIVEAAIERSDGRARAGAILDARLTRIIVPGRRGLVTLPDGAEALLEPLPARLSEGARLRVEISRAAIPEAGRAKHAIARLAAPDAELHDGPDLAARIAASGYPVTQLSPFGPDRLEAVGWSEVLEEAASGECEFEGGALRLSLTPAMTLIDIDGWLDPEALAVGGATAAASLIRRLDISGSIGIDLPTIGTKAGRLAAAEAVDAILPQPYERTAVNGFGFLQIVRRRTRASLAELLQGDPVAAAAHALLRRAERCSGAGARTLIAAPAVIGLIESHPDWQIELERRIGAPIILRGAPGTAISAYHAEAQHP